MTNDILQSDIDLARKLLDDRRPIDEIVAALEYRGVNENRAAQLVADLQAGRTVEPDRPITITLPAKTTEDTPDQPRPNRQSAQGDLGSQRRESRSRQRRANPFPWFTVIALGSAAVCVVIFVILSRKSHSNDSVDQKRSEGSDLSTSDGSKRLPGAGLDARAISIEVGTDGLRLCGKPVARENFLTVIFTTLGASTRTNQMEKADQVIYAYDAFGLLVYAPKGSGHYSVVLDFDASDGTAGTKNPFVGTFKANNQAVRPNTDAASLGSIKDLGLQSPNSASGIFHAQYGGVELLFGYLKSPERLSLIEIDIK